MTYISLLLDDNWDLTMGEDRNIGTTTGKYRVAQDVACSARLFRNDAYYSTQDGIPYWVEALAQTVDDPATIKSYIRRRALLVPNVTGVSSIDFTSLQNRKLEGDIRITDDIISTHKEAELPLIKSFYRVLNVYSLKNVYTLD